MKRLILSTLALTLTAPVLAQEGGDTEITHSALVAGYKAALTCSATFNARQPIGAIEQNELSGIYPDYGDRLATLPDRRD